MISESERGVHREGSFVLGRIFFLVDYFALLQATAMTLNNKNKNGVQLDQSADVTDFNLTAGLVRARRSAERCWMN